MAADDKAAVRKPAGAGGAQSLSELKRLGKYQIDKKIGAGGMGTVFLARDTELKRVVALKVLARDKAENPILVRRFRAEAQAAAQLRHPNIVAVYDSGEADGYLYIAMEYVEGRDLFEMVSRRGTVPVRRSIDVIKQVAAALQHAYEQNIVHRDIKPSNLLIRRDGTVKLTDLGLARSVDDTLETNITRAGTTVGTVDYMAPEQARNSKLADIRSDLYSLGCTWFQMLTGSPPYPDGSVTNKLQAHAIKPIPDPRLKNPQVTEGLTAVIARLMAKKPEDRYQTPADLLHDLEHATLTEAAISREIFGDSDSEISTNLAMAEDEGYSDDGYFELDDVREVVETPYEVPARGSAAAPPQKKTAAPTNEPEETQPVYYKSKPKPTPTPPQEKESEPAASRTKPRHVEPETPDSPSTYKSKPRPIKVDEPEPEPVETSRRSSRVEPEEDTAADPVARRSKPKTDKPAELSTSKSKLAPVKPSDSKPNDFKSATQKETGHKPLPPKRQPFEEAGEAKPLISKDLLRYLTAFAALILVIVGIGWLIAQYSTNFDITKNPLAAPPENPVNQPTNTAPTVVTNPTETATTTEAPSVTAINPGTNSVRPETTQAPVFDADKVPDWATRSSDLLGLPTLTVSAAAKSATNFPTLEQALRAVTSSGAVIKLQGNGPFPLPHVELAQLKRIVITGASPQDRPIIMLKPAENQKSAGLKISDTVVELRGVHFSMDRQIVIGPVKAVEVTDGQLFVQECSFTSTNTSPEPAVALAMTSINDSVAIPRIDPNLSLDRVWVRGDGLTGLSIIRANVDAAIRDSLIVSGSAPTIELSGHLASGAADVSTTKPRRVVRIHRCTLSAANKVFEVGVDDGGKPPQTVMSLRDDICAAQGVVQNSTVITAAKWPQTKSTEGWLTKLSWNSTNTLYLGFEQLIDLESSFKVSDAAAWQRVLGTKTTDARQFQKISFPDSTGDDLNSALPQEFASNGLSYREVKAADGSMPGCPINKLTVPDIVSEQRAVAIASRPGLPTAATKPAEPVQVRKIDLKKEDLGQILNKNDWPSGTMFEASGGGLIYMSPAKIDGKSVRIVFKQSDGASLKILPQPPKGAENSKTVPPALISVIRGSLELTNGVFEGSSNTKTGTPEWLLQATDATVIINGCRLLGPDVEGTKQVGLIRWSTAAGQPGATPAALVIRDSFLAGPGCGIRAECGQGPIFLRNSILAVRGDAIDLRPVRSGNALLSSLDAENVTISATNAAIRFEAAPGTEPVTSPIRMFVEKCVFGPPLMLKPNDAPNATLLQCVGPVVEQKQLEWWGAANGVAKRVVHLVRRDGDSDIPSDEKTGLSAWRKLWNKGSSIRMLTGDRGVYLIGELPTKWRDLKPTSFELHKGSQAATWADAGRAIGANTTSVEESTIAKKSSDAPAVKPTTPNNQKKNVGF